MANDLCRCLAVMSAFALNAFIASAQVGTISIQAKQKTAYTIIYLSFAILAIIILLAFLIKILLSQKKQKKNMQAKPVPIVEVKPFYDREQMRKEREERIKERKREVVIGHLKDDEKQVIEILKQRDGVCEQGTLKVITDFSKAKLSELLSELEQRKIVIKKKKGRKNLVILTES